MTAPIKTGLRELTTQFAQAGKLEAIYLRPGRNVLCNQVREVQAIATRGLAGDRVSAVLSHNPAGSNRQVSLMQAEHIAVISAFLGKPIDASLLRRNLVISCINLLAAKSLFKDQSLLLTIGEVKLLITGSCEPCSKMESALGRGAYNALRGHGGVTAKILQSGLMQVGDAVTCALESAQYELIL